MENWNIWKFIKVGFWLGIGFGIPDATRSGRVAGVTASQPAHQSAGRPPGRPKGRLAGNLAGGSRSPTSVKLSIVIVNYNNDRVLRPCLESLPAALDGLDAESAHVRRDNRLPGTCVVRLIHADGA